jgi:hypothetical protein
VAGTLRISVVRAGEAWVAVDSEGNSFSLIRNGVNLDANRASINAVAAAASVALAAGKVGVSVAGAGAVSLNSIRSNVSALVQNATVTAQAGGDILVDARSASEISAIVLSASFALAGGAGGVAAGIGLSIARNFIGRDLQGDLVAGSGVTSAKLVNSPVTQAGDLRVAAESAQSIKALTFAGAAAIGAGVVGIGVAGAGVFAENRIDATTEAVIDDDGGTGVNAASVTVSARDSSRIQAIGGALALSAAFGKVGVAVSAGVAVTQNVIGSDVLAGIRNAGTGIVATGGAVLVQAESAASIAAVTAAAAVAVSGGFVGVSFAGAGAFATNTVGTTTTAEIASGTVRANGSGDVTVLALGNASIDALVVAASLAFGAGAVGVGVSVGVSRAENRIGSGLATGVFARVSSATVVAGDDVVVEARMDRSRINANVAAISVALAGGAVAVAAAGAGAEAINSIGYAVLSTVSASAVTSGAGTAIGSGDITVRADDRSEITSFVGAAALAGSVGAFGGSVSVGVALSSNIVDNTVRALVDQSDLTAGRVIPPATAGGASTTVLGNLLVDAQDDSLINATAIAASVAASVSLGVTVAGSGARTVARNLSDVTAAVQGTGGDDLVTLTGDATVTSRATPVIRATTGTASVSVGVFALAANGGVVDVQASPTVQAYVQGVRMDADDLSVDARSQVDARGTAYGMSVSTGLSMGGNVVTVRSTPTVQAWAGGGASLNVDDLSVTARAERNAGRDNAVAESYSSAGGLLLGVTSTSATATSTALVESSIMAGSDVNSSGLVSVLAISDTAQTALANAAAVGLVGAGAALSSATSSNTTRALVGTSAQIDAEALTMQATGTAANTATAEAGSGGLVSGAGARPITQTTATVLAEIGDGAGVRLQSGTGALVMAAAHTARPNTFVKTGAFGLIGGSGAEADNNITSDVTARIGTKDNDATGASVTARFATVTATNTVNKAAPADTNIDGDAGGLASAAAADSEIRLDLATVIDIDNGSSLRLTDVNSGSFFRAMNDVRIVDEIALFSAGALGGASADVDLITQELLAKVSIGTGAQLVSDGAVAVEAYTRSDVRLQSLSETYGGATVALGHAKAELRPDHIVEVRGTLRAGGDLTIATGTDKDRRIISNSIVARVDNFAGSLIPIDDLETRAIFQADNEIRIFSGGVVESWRDINLYADQFGLATVDGVAKATNWVQAVGDAIDSLLGGNNTEIGEGVGIATAYGRVINDGTIRTGAMRQKSIEIVFVPDTSTTDPSDGYYEATHSDGTKSRVTFVPNRATLDPSDGTFVRSGTGDIGWSVGLQNVVSSRYTQLLEARSNLQTYSVKKPDGTFVNPDLVAFYQGQITRLLGEMLAAGEAHWVDSTRRGPNNTTIAMDGVVQADEIVPLRPTVAVITIDPVVAQAGRVTVLSDQFSGTGLVDTPRDAKIEIINRTQAFLDIRGALIPDRNGGLLFNGIDITNRTLPNAAINSENGVRVTEDSRQNIVADPTRLNSAMTFTALPVGTGAADPLIRIETATNFDQTTIRRILGVLQPGETRLQFVWPDITISGPVINQSGNVQIVNNAAYPSATGDIILNAEVTGRDVRVVAGGSFVVNGALDHHIAGDPYLQWRTPELTGGPENATTQGTLNAERNGQTAITNWLNQQTGIALKARNLYIDAQFVNINGVVRVGDADYTITLGADAKAQIEAIRASGSTQITRIASDNEDFEVFYDPTGNGGLGRVIVAELRPSGGLVDIKGNVMSTGRGKLVVYGGYPKIEIVNQMTFSDAAAPELVLNRLDASQRGTGQIIIRDLAKVSGLLDAQNKPIPFTTIWTVGDNGVVTKSVNGTPTTLTGLTDTYNPLTGYRYGWTLAQETRTQLVEEYTEADWLGIDAFAPDSTAPDRTYNTTFPGKLIPDSNYFYVDAGKVTDDYTFNSVKLTNWSSGRLQTGYETWSSWYGTNYTWFQYTTITDSSTYFTHTIRADRPIGIEFTGYSAGSVLVQAGNMDVVIQGPIQNDKGSTTISTTGTIRTVGGALPGVIGGRTIVLTGGLGIGTELDPVRVNLSDSATSGLRLDAATTNGAIWLVEATGNLTVGTITAGSGRDVNLLAPGSILRAAGSSLVSGGAITLTAVNGSIGTAAAPISIDTGTTDRDVLRAYARAGEVHVSETAGNLRLFEIIAAHDVSVRVVAGDLLDGNTIEVRDERAIAELRAGVWSDLSLTGGAAQTKIANTLSALAAAKTAEYVAYWNIRLVQGDISALVAPGSTALIALSVEEQAYYDAFYRAQEEASGKTGAALEAAVAAAILTLRTSRTEQFRQLHQVWGRVGGTDGNPDTFDAAYRYTLTAAEEAAIRASIKIWTESELINAIGAGLLKPVTDTDTVIETPNITGRNITLDVSGKVGRASGEVFIALAPGVQLTEEQRVILGAAERDDVFYLTTPRVAATVTFDATVNSITRTDGGTWDARLVGQTILVEGNTANANEEGPFYTVAGLSADGRTLLLATGTGAPRLLASEINQAVRVSGLALDPRGVSAKVTATISGGNTITRTAGGDFSGFKAGMKILLSGATQNGNTASTLYTILSVTADTITLSGTPLTVGETGVALTVDQYVEIAALLVTLREDVDFVATGRLDVEAGGEAFLGTETGVALGEIDVDGALRIRAQGDITNALGAGATNIRSGDLLLESGRGAIGAAGDAGRIYLDLDAGAQLTARGTGSIWLTERQGNMNLATIFSRSGNVDLVAQGSILDALETDFVNIEANDIRLVAQTGTIGAAGNALDIEARGDGPLTGEALGLVHATAAGDIVLTEQFGDLNIDTIASTGGSVTLEAALSILDAVDRPLTGAAEFTGGRAAADVLAATGITLTARLGFIGALGNELDIDSRRGNATGTVSSRSDENTFIIETAGDLWIDTVGVAADGVTTAFLTAVVGSILNGAVAGTSNVTGGRAFLIAQGNIGSADKAFTTAIGTIQSRSTTGSTWVSNTGALLVQNHGTNGVGDGQTAGGLIVVTASSPITVASNQNSGRASCSPRTTARTASSIASPSRPASPCGPRPGTWSSTRATTSWSRPGPACGPTPATSPSASTLATPTPPTEATS